MKNRGSFKFTSLILGMGCITVPLILSSCSARKGINFANFESYMSPELIEKLRNTGTNPVSFLYYPTNEDIEMKFKNYYDLAIPSSYEVITLLEKGELAKIDWTQFAQFDERHPDEWSDIKDGTSALESGMFSSTAEVTIYQIDSYLKNRHIIKDDESLLDYAIPYFLQDWMFAYKDFENKGEIPNLKNPENWDDILKEISPVQNKNLDPRFKPKAGRRIGMVDDSRSVYDMCRLIQTNGQDVNPPDGINTISDYKKTYQELTSKFTENDNYFYINSDSYQILYALADPYGLSSSIAYNGDALYAATGANVPEWEQKYNQNNFFVSKPKQTLVAMDMVVLNKNIKKASESKKKDMYHLLYKTVLDGCFEENNSDGIGKEENGSYAYGPMINFDYTFYTSPLYNLDSYILDDGDGYFKTNFPDKYKLLSKIYTISDDMDEKNFLEKPLSNLNKSNMYHAYIEEKGKI